MDYDMLILKNGGRFDFWITHVDMVKSFIQKQKLQPIPAEMLHQQVAVRSLKTRERKIQLPDYIPWPFPYPGGIRVAHLHYGEEIFYVNAKQWKEFSGMALKSLHEKFNNIGSVSFDGLMNLAGSIEHMA